MNSQILFVIGGILGYILALYCIIVAWRSKKRGWKLLHALLAIIIFCSSLLEFGQAQQPHNTPAPVPPSLHIISGVSESDQLRVESLQASTGAVAWQHAIGISLRGNAYFQVNGNRVYIVRYIQPDAICIEAIGASDDREIWKTMLHLPTGDSSFEISELIFTNGILLVPIRLFENEKQDHELYGLRISDGAQVWHVRPANFIAVADGNIYVSEIGYGEVINGEFGGAMHSYPIKALHISDGVEAWHITIQWLGLIQVIAGGGLLLMRVQNEIRALHASDGTFAWKKLVPSAFDQTGIALLIIANDSVYTQSYKHIKSIIALRASDGAIVWSHLGRGNVFISYTHLYLQGDQLYVFDVFSGKTLWKHPLSNFVTSTSIEAGGIVFISDNGSLYALRSRDGAVLWQRREPIANEGSISYNTPIVADGVVFVIEYNSSARYNSLSQFCLSYCVPFMSINALRVSDGSLYWRYADFNLVSTLGVSDDTAGR